MPPRWNIFQDRWVIGTCTQVSSHRFENITFEHEINDPFFATFFDVCAQTTRKRQNSAHRSLEIRPVFAPFCQVSSENVNRPTQFLFLQTASAKHFSSRIETRRDKSNGKKIPLFHPEICATERNVPNVKSALIGASWWGTSGSTEDSRIGSLFGPEKVFFFSFALWRRVLCKRWV